VDGALSQQGRRHEHVGRAGEYLRREAIKCN